MKDIVTLEHLIQELHYTMKNLEPPEGADRTEWDRGYKDAIHDILMMIDIDYRSSYEGDKYCSRDVSQ
jgi:hypothetical protein